MDFVSLLNNLLSLLMPKRASCTRYTLLARLDKRGAEKVGQSPVKKVINGLTISQKRCNYSSMISVCDFMLKKSKNLHFVVKSRHSDRL